MEPTASAGAILVGIDGSQSAINAALWAVPEAIDRDVPVRLIHVIYVKQVPDHPPTAADLEGEYAETALRVACAAIEATGQPVKVETDILWGQIDSALVDASTDASMVCVGSVGIGFVARALLGSTAAAVAAKALCPVAVIRTPEKGPIKNGASWIAVAVDGGPNNDLVIESAIVEARLRSAPVLAVGVRRKDFGNMPYDELDRCVEAAKERHPDVHVYPVSTRCDLPSFLADNRDQSVQLAVVGSQGAGQLARIVGPHGHPITPHGACSVLVAR